MKPQVNPSTTPREEKKEERTRIPMSVPQQKLSVPDIPGYHLHWMNGNPSRISQALKAGYEFVDPEEVDVVNSGLADSASAHGSTDLGSRVSLSAGSSLDDNGGEQRLYLMKIRQEWWNDDQRKLEDRNEEIAASLRGGAINNSADGAEQRYIPDAHRKGVAEIFQRKTRRT